MACSAGYEDKKQQSYSSCSQLGLKRLITILGLCQWVFVGYNSRSSFEKGVAEELLFQMVPMLILPMEKLFIQMPAIITIIIMLIFKIKQLIS